MRVEGKVRVAGCLRLELVGDAAASVMDVADDHLDLAYLLILASPEAVQARRPRAFLVSSTIERR